MLRTGVADIPAMYTFKQVIGINGVLYATPFAEITSVFIAVFMYLRFQKKMLEKTT